MGGWGAGAQVGKPPEAVWNVIGDHGRTPEWRPRIEAATQSPGPFGPGTKGSVTLGLNLNALKKRVEGMQT